MNHNSCHRLTQRCSWIAPWLAIALLISLCARKTSAAFLNPVEVVYVSTGIDTAPAVIDDINLSDPPSPASTHDEGAGQWTGSGSTKQEMVLDLGQNYTLTKIYLWNYLGDTTVGLKDVEIQVSPDASFTNAQFTAIGRVSLTEGGTQSQTFDIVATDARLVRLKALSNWGQGFTVGFGAVRFETGAISGNVPTVAVLSPLPGDTITIGSAFTISANVADKDNDIDKVEFFDGATLLGTDTTAPYSLTVTNGFTFGEHDIRVLATDKSGKSGWWTVTVNARQDTGGRIIQIDDNRDIGDGVNQIQYSDGWNLAPGEPSDPRFLQNDHYSFTKDSYFEVKFVGTKIEIYATVASHHGLGTAQIDGGDPVDISYAAEQRGEQKFIWASPTLPNREHILRVTVKSGAVVTADRFDVTVPETLTQIDDNRDIGDGVNQIQYSDGWNLAPGEPSDPRFLQNDHYSFTKDSYFEVKFVGTRIEIYATVASHHGLGTAQIDGGDPVDISYAAEQRGEQKFIWASPSLPNREHVLRVTVKSSAVVTADRFDVFSSSGASGDLAGVSKVVSKPGSFQIDFQDYQSSVVAPASMELRIDNEKVNVTPVKTGDITTLLFVPGARYQPGSQHTYAVTGQDTAGNALSTQGTFSIPSPPFPESGLGGPGGTAGNWGFRTVWNAGLINNLAGAVDAASKPNLPGFTGKVQDTNTPSINFGESTNPDTTGIIAGEAPFPAESEGVTANDFAVIGRATVRIPTAGDWTIGVHSDEGFALRFIGAPFASVSGAGLLDAYYPEYIFNGNNTTDSNTRGVLTNLAAGTYGIELLGWERTGVAFIEVYAAPGAFIDDAETADWKLIGEPGGLELVQGAAVPPTLSAIAMNQGQVVITFGSDSDPGSFQLEESADLRTWKTSTGATVVKGANNVHTVSVAPGAGRANFYRLKVP